MEATKMQSGPALESLVARAGVAALVVLSAKIGFEFWTGRGEVTLAYLTLAAEAIAFAGLSMALHHCDGDKARAAGALVLTLLAGGWCGLTTWEKLSADTLTRFEATPGFTSAKADYASASSALRVRLQATAPADKGPRGLAAWNEGQAAAVAALTAAKADASARMQPTFDAVAIARGTGVELVKLFGFVVFAMGRRKAVVQAAKGENVVNFGRGLANLRWKTA